MKRKELLDVLKKVKPGVASKEIVESMTYFYFSGKQVITYNDRISIMHPFKTDFSTFVKANDLFHIVSKSKSDELKMKVKDGKLLIKTKTSQATLATITDDEFTERVKGITKSLAKIEWKDLPDNFEQSVQLCSFAASTAETEQTLSCIYISGDLCMASDNQRIAKAKLNGLIEDKILLKASEIKNLLATDPLVYSLSEAWVHFKNEAGCIFSIRRIKGTYPDFLSVLEFTGKEVQIPTNLTEGIDLSTIFLDDSVPSISITLENNVSIISVRSENGSMKHRSKIKYDGDPITFEINPKFLEQMLAHSTSIIIAKDKAKLETENFTLCTALISYKE